ncbi:cupin domain-containing protein [Janthinobacterium svalbardensis]|uniref:cupin domain-containing protein n=1 Tax=Janthinobacterium svalbardensis TaxID=368607 RepID=UPI0012FD2A7C|nr:cupin domain-containing protein [Janthinobacterium svalbardensis]
MIHHRKLPNYSTLLPGRLPPDDVGLKSSQFQIWYNNTNESWVGDGERLHFHTSSDECFIVLKGAIEVEVEGVRTIIKEREFCFFPVGVFHTVTKVFPPVETLMLHAPSVEDKIYQEEKPL